MAAATKELMWLNEKEEEEVAFDWSDRNTNMAAKKESYSVRQLFLHSTPTSTPSFPTHSHAVPHDWDPLEYSSSGPCGDGHGTWVAPTAILKLSLRPFSLSCKALMRELEMKEKKIKEIQNTGDRLLREDHPARPTVEVGARLQGTVQALWG